MSLEAFINEVKGVHGQRNALDYTYSFLSDKYYGDRIKRFTYIHYLWKHIDLEKMRSKGGPVQCMHINRLLKHILVESGHFQEDKISLDRTFPHQYVTITFDDNTSTYVDIRGKKYGIPLGDFSRARKSKEK